jgi:branched-subunit amino acid ABC-type transport system permease component
MKDLWETFFVAVGGIITTLLGVLLLGLVIGWLLAIMWNYSMPDLFGLPETDWKHMFVLFTMVRLLWGAGVSNSNVKKD